MTRNLARTLAPRRGVLLLLTWFAALFALAAAATASPNVSISSSNPATPGYRGQTFTYTITVSRGTSGTNSNPGTVSLAIPASGPGSLPAGSWSFSQSTVTIPNGANGQVTSTLTVTTSSFTATGTVSFNVIGTHSDSTTGTATGSFTIKAFEAPTISSRTPTSGARGTSASVIINGANYFAGFTSATIDGNGLSNIQSTVNSATQIVLTFDIASNASPTTRTITVSTPVPGGGSASTTFDVVNASSVATTSTNVTGPTASTYGDATTFTATVANLSGSTTPTGNVQFSLDGTPVGSPVALSGGVATFTPSLSAGSHSIRADYQGVSGVFNASFGTLADNVAKAAQTISFTPDPLPGKTYLDADYTITVTGGNSGNGVVLTTSGPITVSGTGPSFTVHITGAGSASIIANQSGNANYSAATQVTKTFSIAKKTPTMSFPNPGDRLFDSGNFSVSATTTPDRSSVTSYALSGSTAGVTLNPTTGAITLDPSTAADASVTITATAAGDSNFDPVSAQVTFLVKEVVKPTVSAAIQTGTGNPGNADWFIAGPNPDPVVEFTGADAGSGVASISYSVDSGAWQTGSTVQISTDGIHTISYKATDHNGNVSDVQTFTVKLDRIAPTPTATPDRTPDHNGWYNHSVVVTFGGTDGGSGFASVDHLNDTLSGDANEFKLTIAVVATDVAGNSSAPLSFTYAYDATPPVVAVNGLSSGGVYMAGTINGLNVIELKPGWSSEVWVSDPHAIGGSFDWTDGTGFHLVDSFPTTYATEGVYTLHYLVTDVAGNSTADTFTFTVDATAPEINPGVVNGAFYKANPLDIHWSIVDAIGPDSWFTLQQIFGDVFGENGKSFLDNSGIVNVSDPDPFSLAPQSDGRFRLTLHGRDTAGNVAAKDNILFFIDTVAPTSSASVTGTPIAGDNDWFRSSVDVLLNVSDAKIREDALLGDILGSGVNSLEYNVDNAVWTAFTAAFTVSGDGTHTVYSRSTDNVGNAEAEHPALQVKIDGTVPTITVHNIDAGRAIVRGGKAVDFGVNAPVVADATSGINSDSLVINPASKAVFPVGTTHVNVSVKDNAGNPAQATFDVVVGKIIQTITFDPQTTATYGDAPIALVASTNADGPSIPVTFTVSGPGHLSFSGDHLIIDGAGTITVTAHAVGDSEYEAAPDVAKTIEVVKAQVTVVADDATKVYGASNPTVTAHAEGLVKADDATEVLAGLTTGVDTDGHVGGGDDHTTVTGPAETANYIRTFQNGTLTITPAPLTITADHTSRVYGDSNPTLTATYSGLVNEDTQSAVPALLTTDADNTSNVGSYPIHVAATSSDYDITLVDGTICVTPASLSVSAHDATRLYGENNPTFSSDIVGAKNGDTFSLSYNTAAIPSSPVGHYAIQVEVAGAKLGNYIVQTTDGCLTVNPAPLTLAVDPQSITYGDALPDPTGTLVGVVNNDAITATFEYCPLSPVNAGDYPIVGILHDPDNKLGNYDVNIANNTLHIAQATPVITWNPSAPLNGDGSVTVSLNGTISATATGENALVLSIASGTGTLTNNQVKATAIGALKVHGHIDVSTNFVAVDVDKDYVVKFAGNGGVLQPLNQTVSASGCSVVKQGSTIPVKVQVYDAAHVSVGTPGTITGLQINAWTNGTPSDINETVISTTPDTSFRWDPTAQQWIFNLSTKNLSRNMTYRGTISFADGTTLTFFFGLK